MTNGSDESSMMVGGSMSGSDVSFNGAVKACGGCGGRIQDRFLLHAMDRYWHTECLKCSCCQTTLEQLGTCFARSGMILCKNDYMRLFGSGGSCASCGQNIPAHEMVMRVHGNTYHLKCFTCVACNTQLTPGSRYALINGSIVCEQDYPKVTKAQVNGNSRSSAKVHGMMTKI